MRVERGKGEGGGGEKIAGEWHEEGEASGRERNVGRNGMGDCRC